MKMPQIPQSDIGERPDSRVSLLRPVDPDEAVKPLQLAAKAAEAIGQYSETRRTALDKKQEAIDEINAITAAGLHREKAEDIATQIQNHNWDTPDKAREDLRVAIRQLTDADIQSAPNANEALKRQRHFATLDNSAMHEIQTWQQSRSTQIAKNNWVKAENAAITGLDKISTAEQLGARLRSLSPSLNKIRSYVSENPEADKKKFETKFVESWVEQRSGLNGQGALDVIHALKDENSFAYKTLDPEKRERGVKIAKERIDGEQVDAGLEMLAAHSKQTDALSMLVRTHDPKFPLAAFTLKTEIASQMEASMNNPALSQETKDKIRAGTMRMLQAVDASQTIYRKHRGAEEVEADQMLRKELLDRNAKIFTKGGSVAPGDHYGEALTLRHDALNAFANGKINYSTYDAVESGLSAMLQVRDTQEENNIGGPLGMGSIKGMSFGMQSPRQTGNERLNEIFTGKYAKATQKQKNDAREYYMNQLLDAAKGGATVDREAALTMAVKAADFAVGK